MSVTTELTLELTQDTEEGLGELAQSLGFSREMAAVYAIRLVTACMREGLLADVPPVVWPEQTRMTGTGGKVLAFRTPQKNARNGE